MMGMVFVAEGSGTIFERLVAEGISAIGVEESVRAFASSLLGIVGITVGSRRILDERELSGRIWPVCSEIAEFVVGRKSAFIEGSSLSVRCGSFSSLKCCVDDVEVLYGNDGDGRSPEVVIMEPSSGVLELVTRAICSLDAESGIRNDCVVVLTLRFMRGMTVSGKVERLEWLVTSASRLVFGDSGDPGDTNVKGKWRLDASRVG